MAIVDVLKKQIEDAGGNTAGIHTIEEACKNLSGIGGGVLVVHADENGTLDKTWKEIYDALCAGWFVSLHEVDEEYDAISIVYACYFNPTSNKYITQAYSYYDETSATYSTGSREGYPQFDDGN